MEKEALTPAAMESMIPLAPATYQADRQTLATNHRIGGLLLRASLTGIFVAGVLILGFEHDRFRKLALGTGLILLLICTAIALAQRWCCLRGFQLHLQSQRAAAGGHQVAEANSFSRRRGFFYRLAGNLLLALLIAFSAAAALVAVVFVLCWQAR